MQCERSVWPGCSPMLPPPEGSNDILLALCLLNLCIASSKQLSEAKSRQNTALQTHIVNAMQNLSLAKGSFNGETLSPGARSTSSHQLLGQLMAHASIRSCAPRRPPSQETALHLYVLVFRCVS